MEGAQDVDNQLLCGNVANMRPTGSSQLCTESWYWTKKRRVNLQSEKIDKKLACEQESPQERLMKVSGQTNGRQRHIKSSTHL